MTILQMPDVSFPFRDREILLPGQALGGNNRASWFAYTSRSRSNWRLSLQGRPSVNAVVECTLPEKILLAAYQLEEGGQSPFSAEALIVSAWQNYPRTFGLKGYTELYPDANKVLSTIMGEKGLAKRGWLIKMGQKLYAMTREGRQIVRRLQQEEDEPAPPSAPLQLNSEQDKLAQSLLGSTAWTKFREGRKMELNFADACRFW